jgi:hypothetical protein
MCRCAFVRLRRLSITAKNCKQRYKRHDDYDLGTDAVNLLCTRCRHFRYGLPLGITISSLVASYTTGSRSERLRDVADAPTETQGLALGMTAMGPPKGRSACRRTGAADGDCQAQRRHERHRRPTRRWHVLLVGRNRRLAKDFENLAGTLDRDLRDPRRHSARHQRLSA